MAKIHIAHAHSKFGAKLDHNTTPQLSIFQLFHDSHNTQNPGESSITDKRKKIAKNANFLRSSPQNGHRRP